MAVSFLRIDDRIIHGQVVVRWSNEYACDGIIAVDDTAANNPVVKSALMSACPQKKTFVWTYEKFSTKKNELLASKKKYFVICRNPLNMAKILVDLPLDCDLKVLNVGPQSTRPGTTNVNRNADITKEEALAFERIHQAGYEIEFQLTPDAAKVKWKDVREKIIEK